MRKHYFCENLLVSYVIREIWQDRTKELKMCKHQGRSVSEILRWKYRPPLSYWSEWKFSLGANDFAGGTIPPPPPCYGPGEYTDFYKKIALKKLFSKLVWKMLRVDSILDIEVNQFSHFSEKVYIPEVDRNFSKIDKIIEYEVSYVTWDFFGN